MESGEIVVDQWGRLLSVVVRYMAVHGGMNLLGWDNGDRMYIWFMDERSVHSGTSGNYRR